MSSYGIAKAIIIVVGKLLWRVRAYGRENVPMSGPLIVACNHISNLDPPLMGAMCPRTVRFMAKKELFDIPVLGPMITSFGTYPVDREGSATAAIKRSVEVLRAGGCIGIFPEGGRNVAGDKEARQGVALLASLGKAPVVPACIVGSAGAKKLCTIKVAFGAPMSLPADRKATRDDLAKFTEEVMSAIHALAENMRGNS